MKTSEKVAFFTAITIAIGVILGLELAARQSLNPVQSETTESGIGLIRALPSLRISGREIGNQTIAHNAWLFSTTPLPESVSDAYVGTSRTKPLRPNFEGSPVAVNGSGNSYNEITYGLLLQAEALRLQFPNLKRVFVEGSLLLRRPNRLIIEDDHRKYLPLLREILPIGQGLPGPDLLTKQSSEFSAKQSKMDFSSKALKQRQDWRLSNLPIFGGAKEILVSEDGLLKGLDQFGQQTHQLAPFTEPSRQTATITLENIKVQRLREIPAWAPWDGLFDMFGLWGKKHAIEVVIFQPPVRSDLYRFKEQFGLEVHNKDLARVAEKYNIVVINLNRPELGYMGDWSLFSDEDHLGTCRGTLVLQSAIQTAYSLAKATNNLFPLVDINTATAKQTQTVCNAVK
jgi:hypothetical protein